MSLIYEALLLAALLLGGSLGFLVLVGHLDPLAVRPALQAFLFVLTGTYFLWQWTHGGQTLAMKTWRLRLVTAAGTPLNVRQAAVRYLFAVCGILLCGIGLAWAWFDPDRQFLHDRLAGTRIIREEG